LNTEMLNTLHEFLHRFLLFIFISLRRTLGVCRSVPVAGTE
jgi:hypothetical protein